MVKITADLIKYESETRLNPLKDRELVLRSYQIPAIENMGATEDLNDAIDFTDNEIESLGNFPVLKRLQRLLLANNRINRVERSIDERLPNLTVLILTNNAIETFDNLSPVLSCKKLTYLSLVDNPIQKKKFYRQYLIHKLPRLRVLDFTKVKQQEREEAKKLFKNSDGTDTELAQSFENASGNSHFNHDLEQENRALTEEEQLKIREALRKAKTPEEIARLEEMIKAGRVP